jgi:hypothetical protein
MLVRPPLIVMIPCLPPCAKAANPAINKMPKPTHTANLFLIAVPLT